MTPPFLVSFASRGNAPFTQLRKQRGVCTAETPAAPLPNQGARCVS